jgi:hypothetical protein
MDTLGKLGFATAAVLTLVVCVGRGPSDASDCPDAKAMFAELDHLKSWIDLHRSFKRFQGRGCDDGAFAEGYSDFVVRTLARQWGTFNEMRSLVDADGEFKAFVLSHIDATADQKDLQRLAANAGSKCPQGAGVLCAAIGRAAKDAERSSRSS